VGLGIGVVDELILHIKEGWDLERLRAQFVLAAKRVAPELSVSCNDHTLFQQHANAIHTAARHFLAGDHLSAAHLLYPRIEGILRHYYHASGATTNPKQNDFLTAAAAGARQGRHGYCLLLLDRFEAFLRNVIFVAFDPLQPAGVSRHTIAHGLATACDDKSVAVALLTLHHLFYTLRSPTP